MTGQRAQSEAHGDKVQHDMFPVGERQDQPLRNTSVPLFSTHGHTPKGIERGVEEGADWLGHGKTGRGSRAEDQWWGGGGVGSVRTPQRLKQTGL
ncbi:hypothetical protein NQZ68_033607, partial [Dissostichus eleginoides]